MAVKKAKKTHHQKQPFSKEKQTRLEILRSIADQTGLQKIQVKSVFLALSDLLYAHLGKKGSGEVTIPIVGIKVRRVKKKATKPRTMVSPLTGQAVVIHGKPARFAIKLSALKPLKSIVSE